MYHIDDYPRDPQLLQRIANAVTRVWERLTPEDRETLSGIRHELTTEGRLRRKNMKAGRKSTIDLNTSVIRHHVRSMSEMTDDELQAEIEAVWSKMCLVVKCIKELRECVDKVGDLEDDEEDELGDDDEEDEDW